MGGRQLVWKAAAKVLEPFPYFTFLRGRSSRGQVEWLKRWLIQRVVGINKSAYWPMHYTSRVWGPSNVHCGVDANPGIMPGCYIQAVGRIEVGDYSQIGPNVGLITANHELYDNSQHSESRPVTIGRYCWIGMNSIILPGVELGDFTVVGAGSVVTRPFRDGYCVLAGNPARVVRDLDRDRCVEYTNAVPLIGYQRA